ncbi:hypothetical protein WR25_03684 isoform B [Diploscapter pachys]|uniref:HECT domain-containing protein n=1 Tax=Diploscapter pachys TaxID=2018661 RepID=A0A2A2LNS9_9BILA|nr:hypothetical protein WR25_03684 isoform A [Diploscapter pachys]PAV87904.1 hypothetical protein WR25_03684 isoform B [Diploscapter pachys]
MIPPLMLQPEAADIVLDMCAAPGSKTSQLIEMMHEKERNPAGMLIANDLDMKRCYMLVHQTLKRFRIANCVITCNDASKLPNMRGKNDEPLKFDKVLCDVICSGDGTVRKNPDIWARWTPHEGLSLHRMQLPIAKRENYGISNDFPYENLFNRRGNDNNESKQLFYANEAVKHFVENNMFSVSIQNAGMKMFGKNDNKADAPKYRIAQEGVQYIFPFMGKQKTKIPREDMLALMEYGKNLVPMDLMKAKDEIRQNNSGSVILYVDDDDPVCAWIGFHSVAPYVTKEERVHILRMMGVDCTEIEELMKSKRKQKARENRQEAKLTQQKEMEEQNGQGDTAGKDGQDTTLENSKSEGKEDIEMQEENGKGEMRELLACGLCAEGQLGEQIELRKANVRIPERVVGAPMDLRNSCSVRAVAIGERHTILLDEDGKMWSCGANDECQCGLGHANCEARPFIQPVRFHHVGTKIIQIAAGRAHSLAVAEDGRLFAWGSNSRGALAQPSKVKSEHEPTRVRQLTEVIQVASGSDHCIAICDNGRVFVWGEQQDGKILHEPAEVAELLGIPITRVAAGERHCIAISISGSVWSWGQNDHGQLGTGDIRPRASPCLLASVSRMKVVEAACGNSHTILLTNDGRLFAFGSNFQGQIGCGSKVERHLTPIAVSELMGSHVTRIAVGGNHSIAVMNGRAFTFGVNCNGQLGNGSDDLQRNPKPIYGLDKVSSVFAGYNQTFFLRDGRLQEPISGPNSAMKVPKFLSSTIVKKLLEEHEKLDLIGLIEAVFQSLSCINGSFLCANEKRFLTGDESNSGVDMDDVMAMFQALADSSDKTQYGEIILEMLKMSLLELEMSEVNWQWAETLRVFLIMPWFHLFTDNVKQSTVINLHIPYAIKLHSLGKASGDQLTKWFGGLTEMRHFNRMVASLLEGVRCMVKAKESPGRFFQILDILNSLSIINLQKKIIPVDRFYIKELNDNYDLKMDYAEFVMTQPQKVMWAKYPFLMDGLAKSDLIYVETILRQHQQVSASMISFLGMQLFTEQPYYEMHIRRDYIVRDTMSYIRHAQANDLRKPLKITIANEEADDAGGVKKEFFMLIFQKILQNDYGMFTENEQSHLTWFSGLSLVDEEEEGSFQMLGKLCGLAVYNRVIVNLPFPLALYKLILNEPVTLEDLKELSPTEGKSLQDLLDYEQSDFEDVFFLTFTINYDIFGAVEEVELKPSGATLPVNQSNKQEYVELYVQHRLTVGFHDEIKKQIESFCTGFRFLVNSRVLGFFQPIELMEMIVGNENYEWSEFRKVVEYKGEYHEKHPAIQAFWKAFFELTDDEKKMFLQFLSGSSRLPVAGMSAIKCYIQPTAPDTLPVAHTCFNLLDLPNIEDDKELLRRLRISIQHSEGFTLRVLTELEVRGVEFEGSKMLKMDRGQAARLYECHKGKFFYNRLIRHMCSGPILAIAAKGDVRSALGSSKLLPLASPYSIRQMVAISDFRNVAHNSDPENAESELSIFEPLNYSLNALLPELPKFEEND